MPYIGEQTLRDQKATSTTNTKKVTVSDTMDGVRCSRYQIKEGRIVGGDLGLVILNLTLQGESSLLEQMTDRAVILIEKRKIVPMIICLTNKA